MLYSEPVSRPYVICVALAAAIAAGACGNRRTAQLEQVKEAVCACKTASCADDAMKALPSKDIPSNPRTQQIAREMMDCLSKLYTEGRPTTDPDAPQPDDRAASASTP